MVQHLQSGGRKPSSAQAASDVAASAEFRDAEVPAQSAGPTPPGGATVFRRCPTVVRAPQPGPA
jgi:hypothetical protein